MNLEAMAVEMEQWTREVFDEVCIETPSAPVLVLAFNSFSDEVCGYTLPREQAKVNAKYSVRGKYKELEETIIGLSVAMFKKAAESRVLFSYWNPMKEEPAWCELGPPPNDDFSDANLSAHFMLNYMVVAGLLVPAGKEADGISGTDIQELAVQQFSEEPIKVPTRQ